MLPDRGDRYLDQVYDDEWVARLPAAEPALYERPVDPAAVPEPGRRGRRRRRPAPASSSMPSPEAFALHARRETVQPLKPYLRWRPDGHIADRIIAMPAYVGGDRPVAGLKWIGSKHDNPARAGLERASALIVLNDPDTHYPVAVMEGALISAARTAAVTAVAARHLALAGVPVADLRRLRAHRPRSRSSRCWSSSRRWPPSGSTT